MSAEPERGLAPRARRTVLAFNQAVTGRDVDALGRLMTEDHTFIDSEGNVISGRAVVLAA